MDEAMKEHNEKHCQEISQKCPFCSLRRMAEALELIAVMMKKRLDRDGYAEVVQ